VTRRRSTWAVLTVGFLFICVLGTLTTPVAAGTAAGGNVDSGATLQHTQSTQNETIEFAQELRLVPDRPGEIEVEHEYEIPTNTTSIDVGLPLTAVVTWTDGFEQTGPQTYSWDQRSEDPQLRYRIAANQTAHRSGATASDGRLVFADTGDWAIVKQPSSTHRTTGATPDSTVAINRTPVVEDGIAGTDMAYLGPYDEFTHTAHNQTFRLIVPAEASLHATPEAIFETISYGAGELEVGVEDDTVLLIAAPTGSGSVPWASKGVQSGSADLWVQDTEPTDVARNVWLHEYLHTQQSYETDREVEWFTEATATYYAALLTYEQGEISFATFESELSHGESDRYSGAILSNQETWEHRPDYTVGPLVVGAIDRELRTETDGQVTFQSVFRSLNEHDGAVNEDVFFDAVLSTGTETIAANARTYVTTTDRPSMWDSQTHTDAFDSSNSSVGSDIKGNWNTTATLYPTVADQPTQSSTGLIHNNTDRKVTQASSHTIPTPQSGHTNESGSGVAPIALCAIGGAVAWRRYRTP